MSSVRNASDKNKQKQGVRYEDHGFIFATSRGTPQDPGKLQNTFAAMIEEVGVPKLTFHDLRDSHASRLQAIGIDLGAASDRLRHSRKSTTADKYTHTLTVSKLAAVKILDELFSL